MGILKYKDYEGTAEVDTERGVCRGKILFISDLVTYEAETPVQLQAQFQAAVEDYEETCRTLGREPQRPFKGVFNVRLLPALHRAAALRAADEGIALNELMVRAVDAYVNVRTDVNHNHHLRIILETSDEDLKVVTASVSGEQVWGTAQHVTH